MPTYSLATVALALDIDRKHLENILAQQPALSTPRGKQGRARRLPRDVVLVLAAVNHLQRELSIPLAAAVRLVDTLRRDSAAGLQSVQAEAADGTAPRTYSAGVLALTIDFAALERHIAARLAEALEIAPRPRRGRPPLGAR